MEKLSNETIAGYVNGSIEIPIHIRLKVYKKCLHIIENDIFKYSYGASMDNSYHNYYLCLLLLCISVLACNCLLALRFR